MYWIKPRGARADTIGIKWELAQQGPYNPKRAYRVEVEWLKTTDFLPKVTGSKPCVHKIGTGFAAKPGGSRHGGMEVTEQGHPLGGGDGAVTVRAGPVLHAREMTKTKRVDRRRIGSRISQGLPRG